MWVLCGEGRSESNLHILLQPWFELVFSQLGLLDTIFPPPEGSWACSCTNSAAPLAKGWTFFLQATHCKSPKWIPSHWCVWTALGIPEHIKMTLVKTLARCQFFACKCIFFHSCSGFLCSSRVQELYNTKCGPTRHAPCKRTSRQVMNIVQCTRVKEQHAMFLTERVAACAALAFSKCPPTQSVLPLDWLVPFVLYFFHLFICEADPWITDRDHCSQISLRIFQYFLSGKTSKVNDNDKWAFAKLKSTRKSTLRVTRWSVRNRKNLMIAIKRKNKYCSQQFSRIDDPIFQMIPSSCFWGSISVVWCILQSFKILRLLSFCFRWYLLYPGDRQPWAGWSREGRWEKAAPWFAILIQISLKVNNKKGKWSYGRFFLPLFVLLVRYNSSRASVWMSPREGSGANMHLWEIREGLGSVLA